MQISEFTLKLLLLHTLIHIPTVPLTDGLSFKSLQAEYCEADLKVQSGRAFFLELLNALIKLNAEGPCFEGFIRVQYEERLRRTVRPTEQQKALMCSPSEPQRDAALCQLGARTSDKEMTVLFMLIIRSRFPLFSKSTIQFPFTVSGSVHVSGAER